MDFIFKNFVIYRSCCLNCGAFSVKSGLHCLPCESKLNQYRQNAVSILTPIRVRSLYSWEPRKSDMLSRMILKLKGRYSKKNWEHYSRLHIQQNISEIPQFNRIYIVPAPSKDGKKDHAYFWAEGLARAIGAEVLPIFVKTTNHSQRHASRGERALIELEINEKYTKDVDFSARSLWIFADDVVTTGATARAAHKSLGYPCNFEVWALAQRSLSCGATKDLL